MYVCVYGSNSWYLTFILVVKVNILRAAVMQEVSLEFLLSEELTTLETEASVHLLQYNVLIFSFSSESVGPVCDWAVSNQILHLSTCLSFECGPCFCFRSPPHPPVA